MTSKFRTIDIVYAGMFAALMAIGANITSWAPFLQIAGVPLSMQPFFCILAGLLLGSRLGAISMLVYLLVGVAGAPVFAGFSAGIPAIIGNTGGFVLSYIPTAYIVGKMVEKSKQPSKFTFIMASLVGIVIVYLIGTNYMYLSLNLWLDAHIGYQTAWAVMTWFAVKDLIFTIVGGLIAPRLYHTIKKSTHQSTQTYVA